MSTNNTVNIESLTRDTMNKYSLGCTLAQSNP